MSYRVERVETQREPFAAHWYRIYRDDRLPARYWHDYRGDEHGIEFLDGTSEVGPVGRMEDFLEGGGPSPLVLSRQAIAYLDQRLS